MEEIKSNVNPGDESKNDGCFIEFDGMRRASHNLPVNEIVLGDCENVLRNFPDHSIDFIVTSPPYADNRKSSFQGVHPDNYVDWFLPKSEQLLRVAQKLKRKYIGIELKKQYRDIALDGLKKTAVLV